MNFHATTLFADYSAIFLIAASWAAFALSRVFYVSALILAMASAALVASWAFLEWTSEILFCAASITFLSSASTLSLIVLVINYLCSFFSSLSARSLYLVDFKLVVWSLASAIALRTDEFGFLIVRVPGSSGHGSLTGKGVGT